MGSLHITGMYGNPVAGEVLLFLSGCPSLRSGRL